MSHVWKRRPLGKAYLGPSGETAGSFLITFTFTNKCPYTVWPAALSNREKPQFPSTGFQLANGASESIVAPAGWEGRFWARTDCSDNNGRLTCATGDCGSGQLGCNGAGGAPPTTLAEFTLNGDGGKDFYDVSLVDGFSLPLSVIPESASGCGSPCLLCTPLVERVLGGRICTQL